MLNKPVGMRFIIADTTAVLHMGRGDFVLPLPFRGGDSVRGDYVQGDFVRFPVYGCTGRG